jgi:dimethylamine/trimethylamine dehydrogenase
MPIAADANVFTPDDLMDGSVPGGKVIVFDDDHYYMGGVMAELLAAKRRRCDADHDIGLRV